MRLGLDLKGGVHLVLRVQTDDALRSRPRRRWSACGASWCKAGAAGVTATVVDPTDVRVDGVPDAQAALVRQLGTEIEHTYNRESGAGGTYRFTMKPNIAVQLRDDTVDQASATIERRVNELGVAEPIVARQGARGSDPGAAARRHRRRRARRRSSARRRCSS